MKKASSDAVLDSDNDLGARYPIRFTIEGLPKDLNHEFAGLEAEESIAKELDDLKKRVSRESDTSTEVN